MTESKLDVMEPQADSEEPDVPSSEGEVAEDDDVQKDEPNNEHEAKSSHRRSISISLRGLLVGVFIAISVIAVGTLGWLYIGAREDLDALNSQRDNNAHAEQVALDYAVNAAAMNFNDIQAWTEKLVAGTSPELKEKLTEAATSMEQILVPLQWKSTARPLAAKVRSVTNGIYVVDSFVSVVTMTVQAPDGLQSTATYSVTIDSNNGWQITDVGGIGAVPGAK